jgi:hypothetical protein
VTDELSAAEAFIRDQCENLEIDEDSSEQAENDV